MLRDHTSLRLAVLNACEAGRTDPVDPFGGVADTLVRRGIPAVIAMQFEVSDKAAMSSRPRCTAHCGSAGSRPGAGRGAEGNICDQSCRMGNPRPVPAC